MRLRGKQQVASGSKPHWKLDVSSENYLVECKLTDKKSFSITKTLLEKVRREAAKEGKMGVVELDIDSTICYVVPPEFVEAAINQQEVTDE